MAGNLKNKIVVITGGAEGIGYHIADSYLQNEVKHIVLIDLNENQGKEATTALTTKYGARVTFIKCDITADLEAVSKKIFSTFQNIDVLVNNAGILNDGNIKQTIGINVTALIEWSFAFWEHMRKDKNGKGGTIINIASIYGYRIDQFLPVYQASKFAVVGFTKYLGHVYNYERSGVRIIAICPGFTETKLTSAPATWDDDLNEDFDKFLKAQAWQKAQVVGKAAVDIFEVADSGTAWLIEGSRPVTQILNQ